MSGQATARCVRLVAAGVTMLGVGLCACAAPLEYWQLTVGADGAAAGPVPLQTVERDAPPSAADPVQVTPRPVEGAREYVILRIPSHPPAAPAVEVRRPGQDTLYYWLVGHAGLFRSPIAGPAVAANCDKARTDNRVTWPRTAPYTAVTVLRTDTPEPPAGIQHALIAWGTDKGEAVDTAGALALADYPCHPQGTAAGRAPVGTGPFLVGRSTGDAILDTGELKPFAPEPTRSLNEKRPNQFQAANPPRAGALNLQIRNDQPGGQYDWGGPVGLNIDQTDLAGGHNDYAQRAGGPHVKSFHIPLYLWQHNFTYGQVANQVVFSEKHGEGDNVIFTVHNTTEGLIEDGGDEGTEVFMSSATRKLTVFDYALAEDAPRLSTRLKVGKAGRTGAGRAVVNLSRAVKDGAIVRIDDDMKIVPELPDRHAANRVTRLTGEGTQWTPAMAGWYVSLDCDTRADGIRQWYRVTRVNSPTSMDILAYTYFSPSTYLGHAGNVVRHGAAFRAYAGDKGIKHEPRPSPDAKAAPDGREPYQLAPATNIADPSLLDGDLHVMPLKEAWSRGDTIQVVAGPQNCISIGKFGIHGKLLPQDWVHGLWMHNWSDRLSNAGALVIMGKWNKGVEIILDDEGLSDGVKVTGTAGPAGGAFVAPADTTALRIGDVPVVLAGRSASNEVVFARDTAAGSAILGLGSQRVTLGDGVRLAGNPQVRGRTVLSGDGRTATFTIPFAAPYPEVPHIVASSNLPLGMGVDHVTPEGFSVTYAAPPPAGKDNIAVTWIAVE
ncbi:MAG: hypothetical protein BWZ02_00608 [Lentisphaerae bacterium ADurb.BinA184]|nr:MAG: hypothetical protein BWZ02_00608 [Lentisphaerae bacterium ADurb.BinA184]